MNHKKLLHILHEIEYSGAEIMLNYSANYFKEHGYELHALNSEPKLGNFAPTLESSGFKIIHIPNTEFWKHLKQFHHILKREKYSVIHNHTEQYFFWYALIARLNGIKFLYMVHSNFVFSRIIRIKRTFYRLFAKFVFNVTYVAISNNVQKNELKQFFNRTTLIPNWVNPDVFFPVKNQMEKETLRNLLNIPLKSFVLLSVGTCNEVKNHIDIVKAMAIVKLKYNDILYLNIGDGPMREPLEKMTQDLGLSNQIYFLGQRGNVKEYLRACDLYIMTSRFEGLSISMLEALSCELPAIVYNNRGLRDLVINGKTGFLIDEKPEILAEKIIELYKDPNLTKKMGEESGRFVKENYNMYSSVEKLHNLYQS